MRLKEFAIFCSFVALLAFVFLALTTTVFLPRTTIPMFDGFIILVVFAVFVIYLMLSNLLEVKKMNYKIQLRNSQLETILNNVDITLLLRDLDGTILAMNHGNPDILGYSAKEMVGKNIRDFVENLDEIIEATDKEVIEKKNFVKYSHFVESRKGVGTHLRIGKFPFLDEKGNVSKFIVCYVDGTLEQNIEKTKNEFIETLTHDLKTPTVTQIKALDLLLQGYFGKLTDSQNELVNQVKSSCIYMNDLIFTILDTYIIEKGQVKLNLTNINMSDLVKEVLQELKWFAHEKSKTMFVNIESTSNYINADRLQIKRVIFNLVSNAIKYGESDSVVDIVVKDIDNDCIDFQIRNKSTFLTEKDLSNIFDKYKSKSNSKINKVSTGLGLYLSKQIIEKHNGEIYAQCKDNDICIFGFKIKKHLKTEQLEQKTECKL